MSATVVSFSSSRVLGKHLVAGTGYRPDIDGLRALAALAVLATHTIGEFVPGGRTGVDMFFALSGFLISGIILRSLARGSFSFAGFYSRRVRRIFPALLALLLAVWIAGWLFFLPEEQQRLGKGIATSAAFSWDIFAQLESNFWDLKVQDPGGLMLAQLWSLGVEEQFYLLWPLLLVTAWRLSKGNLTFMAVSIALVATVALVLFVAEENLPGAIAIAPWRGVFGLAAGSLLACLQLSELPRLRKIRTRLNQLPHVGTWLASPNLAGCLAMTLLIISIFSSPGLARFPGSDIVVPTAGALLLICAGPNSLVNRLAFGCKPMVFVGLLSYPLYLWHFPLVMFLDLFTVDQPLDPWTRLAVVLPAAMILAFLTYRYVELPIRHHPAQSRVVGALVAAMIACFLLGLATLYGVIRPVSLYTGGDLVRAAGEDWAPGSNRTTWTRFQNAPITIGRGAPQVLFMGDSSMQQYYPRIEQLYRQEQFRARAAIFVTRFGCVPGIDELHMTRPEDRRACREHLREAMSIANDPQIDTVVIAAGWYMYYAAPAAWRELGRAAPFRPGSDAALDALKATLRDLTSRGKKVYLVLNIPVGRSFDPRSHGHTLNALSKRFANVADARVVRAALEPIHGKLRQVAQETGAITIDPLKSLCDRQSCPATSAAGTLRYRDMWHLRPSYVRSEVRFLDAVVLRN